MRHLLRVLRTRQAGPSCPAQLPLAGRKKSPALDPGHALGRAVCLQRPVSRPLTRSLNPAGPSSGGWWPSRPGKTFSGGTRSGEACHGLFCSGGLYLKRTRTSVFEVSEALWGRPPAASRGGAPLLCVLFPCPRVSKASRGADGALSVETACGERVASAAVAASVGGGEAVPGLGCDGHLHAEGRGEGQGAHIQGREGGVQGVERGARAPGEQAPGAVGLQ